MKVNMTAFLSLATAAITTFPTSHFISAFSGTISKRSPFLAKGARISSLFSTTAEPPVDNDTTQNNDSSASIYDVQAEALSKVQSPFLQTMRDRGFLHQCTNLEELDKSMVEASKEGKALSAYLGFDATADSLHVGSLLQIMILRHYQKSGHQPIVLIGGGTSKVGDPTGKDESRKMLTEEVILQNTAGISKVFQKFLTFKDDKSDSNIPSEAIMVNNDDWLSTLKYLEFLRDYGTHFTINRMLSFESVKQRLAREAPFSFLEFNYMILQAYDFLELNRRYGAKLQLGGSDQWGNIVAGTELGRRCDGVQLFGLTAPLITTSDGKKMGKTANGAVWLNADRLSEYDYWQFWRNTADADVLRFMKLFTELPLEDINEMSKLEGADINKAKIVLADEATALLHGKDCLPKIHETVENMFKSGSGGGTESLPRIFVTKDDLGTDSSKLLDLFLNLKLGSSKKDIRRLIEGGGAKLGETVISDQNASLTIDDFNGSNEVVLRAGKKRAGVVELK